METFENVVKVMLTIPLVTIVWVFVYGVTVALYKSLKDGDE